MSFLCGPKHNFQKVSAACNGVSMELELADQKAQRKS